MLRRAFFIIAHQVGDRSFYPTYRKMVKNQWKSYEELKKEQDERLRYMIKFVYKNVPYYKNLFDDLSMSPDNINKVEDLEKLPILNKEIIKQNWESFKPFNLNKMKYYENATGGSTGTPFKYRLHKHDRFLGGAMLYRGWGYGGYKLGEKIAFMGGASLDIGIKSNLIAIIHEVARNIRMFSSFDMGIKEMKKYVKTINLFKPKFIRGYASSIYFFSKWIEKNNLEIHQPLAVFTTAEMLHPNMREKIKEVFNCEIYDTYGLNDGGVSAFECPEHLGLHIDTERSIMEVVDENGNQLNNGEGRILATSLYNYAMPFIRYDTGDIGCLTNEVCGCGRGYRLLKGLVGRSVDFLVSPEGKNIHGWFFLYIFWNYCKGVKEYQVVQEKIDKITINIVSEEDFDEKQLDNIKDIIRKRSKGWDVEFKFVEEIERTSSGKYKFIVNKIQ